MGVYFSASVCVCACVWVCVCMGVYVCAGVGMCVVWVCGRMRCCVYGFDYVIYQYLSLRAHVCVFAC